jgi:hypothetical protein
MLFSILSKLSTLKPALNRYQNIEIDNQGFSRKPLNHEPSILNLVLGGYQNGNT